MRARSFDRSVVRSFDRSIVRSFGEHIKGKREKRKEKRGREEEQYGEGVSREGVGNRGIIARFRSNVRVGGGDDDGEAVVPVASQEINQVLNKRSERTNNYRFCEKIEGEIVLVFPCVSPMKN